MLHIILRNLATLVVSSLFFVFASSPSFTQEQTALSEAAIHTLQHDLRRVGLVSDSPTGIWDEATREAANIWLKRNRHDTTPITVDDLRVRYDIRMIAPHRVGEAQPVASLPELPFIFLGHLNIGGADYRSHYNDPKLAGITLQQCVAACAADTRCNLVGFDHGCALMSSISYRHDYQRKTEVLNDEAAVLVSRAAYSETREKSAEGYKYLSRSEFQPRPIPALPESPELSVLVGDQMPSIDLSAFRTRAKVTAATAVARSYLAGTTQAADGTDVSTLASKLGGSAPDFHSFDWVFITDAHETAADAWEAALEAKRATDTVVPLFDKALAEAEITFGSNHPVLALLLHDMAEALSWYQLKENDDWLGAESRRQIRRSQASRLLLNTQLTGHPQAARREAAIHIGSINIDQLLYAENPDPSANTGTQWGRCFEDSEDNRKRSIAILRAAKADIQIRGITPTALGWLSRAEDCQRDHKYLLDIAGLQVRLASETNTSYLKANAWARLGRVRFNAEDMEGARSAFTAAFSVFSPGEPIDYLPFIHDFRQQTPPQGAYEYYAEGDRRKFDLVGILLELNMQNAVKQAFVYEFDELLTASDAEAGDQRDFIEVVLSVGDPDFAAAVLGYLDTQRSGRQPGQPLLALFTILDGTGYPAEYDADILDDAQILIDLPEAPQQRIALLTRIAESKDLSGDVKSAANLSQRALDLVAKHRIPASDQEFLRLRKLVAAARREDGDVDALAQTLASGLEVELDAVCSGRLRRVAFPTLPIELLYDDPLLSDAFIAHPIISDYLSCFRKNRRFLAQLHDEPDQLPIVHLLDLAFVLGKRNEKREALYWLRRLSPQWAKDRGAGVRQIAISRMIDGLILADRQEWLEEARPYLSFSNREFDKGPSDFTVKLAFSFHALGWRSELNTVERALFSQESFIKAESLPPHEGFSCETFRSNAECEYAFFVANTEDDADLTAAQKRDFPYGLRFHGNVPGETRSMGNGLLYFALHQKAGRNYLAKLYAESRFLSESTLGVFQTLSTLLSDQRVLNRKNVLRYLSVHARLELENGNRENALKITKHVLASIARRANSFSSYGQDPVIRVATRLSPILETHLAATDLPVRVTRAELNATSTDLVLAGQILQITNTAATYAKLSSRISSNAGAKLRELQQVTAQINDIHGALLEQGANDRDFDTQLQGLQARSGNLVKHLSENAPADLAGTTLRFPDVDEVMDILRPSEAILAYYVGREESYAWLFTQNVLIIRRLKATEQEISDLVQRVRQTTTPAGFDKALDVKALSDAHELLVEPFSSDLNGIETLVLVPHGPLDSLPFGALITEPYTGPEPVMSDAIRNAQLGWLIRDYSLAQVPSLSAAHFLRTNSTQGDVGRKPFFGVGNPVFDNAFPAEGQTVRGGTLFSVPRLPETELELRTIAAVLRADPERDLLLADEANEQNLRAAQLGKYQTIAFATHGVIANELPGVTEPALLLTPGQAATETEDGVLLASEVATLDLNADMVILSACNTASSDGTPGAEGLSGLASAFFFAGARQLMVTHWQIPSRTALEISIGATIYQKDEESTGWPNAMRRAKLDLIDNKGASDIAHPMNWAAYSLIGMP